jgi:hypothetical protein
VSDVFSISVGEWLGPGTGNDAERATNAEIAINVGEHCVTQVEDFDSRTVRSTIRVSAEPIAKWILANWWRLMSEAEPVLANDTLDWSMSHSMAAIGSGYVWPDLVFRGSDGSQIAVVCKRHLAANMERLSPIRFLNSFAATTITVADFENSTRSFVKAVLARLAEVGIRKSELHDLWDDLNVEWADPRLASYRKLEALLGLEPDGNDVLVLSVLKWGKQFGQGAVEELAAESSRNEILGILGKAKTLAGRIKTFAEIPGREELSALPRESALPVDAAPWQRAQSLAYALREKWGFGHSPIRDEDLADRLSLDVSKLRKAEPGAPFSFGFRGPAVGKVGLLLSRESDHGRRFDTARLIGDYLSYDRDEKIMPATNTMTVRQKFQRAFAAEFLCPSIMIKERYVNGIGQRSLGKVIDDISSEYNVADQVVLHHMENRKVLSQELIESPLLLA